VYPLALCKELCGIIFREEQMIYGGSDPASLVAIENWPLYSLYSDPLGEFLVFGSEVFEPLLLLDLVKQLRQAIWRCQQSLFDPADVLFSTTSLLNFSMWTSSSAARALATS
jgi:hypothetical protein